MKKLISKLLVFAMLIALLMPAGVVSRAAEVNKSGARAIYVVFDNSGSMYGPGNMAWSQATYAMEVFAAMMNYDNGDQMKIFPMHDVTTGGTGSTSSITVRSISDIAQIHNMYTPQPLGTPYTQVNTAANELAALLDSGGAAEGWLVVLTDGDFDSDLPATNLQTDLEQKAEMRDNMYVQYLAMGSDIKTVADAKEEIGLYSQKVENSSQVINELAVISNRIFERNEYTSLKNDGSLSFDIPLSRLIVFAQGSDVSINSLKNKEGSEINLESNYEVSCSSTDGGGLTSFVTETPAKDTSLKGQVAVFSDTSAIMEGDYTLDVAGADSVKIYYEPDVKFGAGLYRGDDQVDASTIEGGTYSIRVGFINQLTGEFIENTSLLGEPEYKLTVNGEEYGLGGSSGAYQSVEIQADGDLLEISADVTYLNNYTDHIDMSFQVCTLDMEVEAPKSAALKEIPDGSGRMTVEATRNGEPLTEEQWKNASVDVECKDSEGGEFSIEWEVEPGEEVSTWTVSPRYKDGDMFSTGIGPADITVSVSTEIDGQQYGKSENISMEIKDDRNPVDYLKRYWKEISICLLLLILVLGYVPPFKKRFPGKMKRRPSIECTAEKIGIHDMIVKGNFEKNIVSMLIPYKAETGRLTFSPAPVKKTARLKAAGGGGIWLLNTSAFQGKDDITFNGMSIPENYKGNYRMSASTIIVVSTPEFTYTCIPNVQRTADGKIKKSKGKKKK
ncbi:hypothetical protein H6B07_01510 [Mediterraneibacter glycyrrhizinilyticus]|uniref:hypothetical protein n=1 Tax=Mediterraneibacter glycyrrhizinilyticus TaxID=342942 RepID=UPI001961077A|nr:hypothetical protein [Mediterraneibacter glycyrrhizinilyticus]MBM6801353.1 hypothetical protein [Mediterraneibacter glycyrrhizinilyticus]MDM8123973.1 hypothetical protein [Mediterraneibacter glycyrrhizinilyticus]